MNRPLNKFLKRDDAINFGSCEKVGYPIWVSNWATYLGICSPHPLEAQQYIQGEFQTLIMHISDQKTKISFVHSFKIQNSTFFILEVILIWPPSWSTVFEFFFCIKRRPGPFICGPFKRNYFTYFFIITVPTININEFIPQIRVQRATKSAQRYFPRCLGFFLVPKQVVQLGTQIEYPKISHEPKKNCDGTSA